MKIDKVKKLKRQKNVFDVLIYIFSIVLGIILSLLFLGTILTTSFLEVGFIILIFTFFYSIYFLPIVLLIGIILLCMYFAKMLRFNKEKRKMMGYIIISTIFLVTLFFFHALCFLVMNQM